MTSRFRALSRDVAIYGVGEIAVKAFGFITIPIYTRLFSPDEYGVIGYVATAIGLLSAVLILGGDSAYARYFLATTSRDERRIITSTWLGFLAAWSALCIVALLPLATTVSTWSFGQPGHAPLFSAAFLAAPLILMNRMCGQVLRNEYRATAFTTLNLLGVALTVVLSVGAATTLGLGLLGIFVGMLLGELVLLPIRLWTVRHMLVPRCSLAMLGRLLAFGLPLVPTSIAYWVFLTSDRIVLAQLSTLEQAGFYTVAVGLVAVPSVAINAVGQAWTPHVIEAYETHRAEAERLVARVARYLIVGFGLLSVAVTVFAPEAIGLLTTSRYAPAAAAVAPLALAMVAQASTSVTALGITMAKRTVWLAAVAWLAALVNLALNLALDTRFGMLGAAWATTVAYAVLTVTYLVVSQRLWPVGFEWRPLATGLLATTLFTLAGDLVRVDPLALGILVKSLYCLAYLAVVLGLGVLPRADLVAASRLLRSG